MSAQRIQAAWRGLKVRKAMDEEDWAFLFGDEDDGYNSDSSHDED